ncbi:MAG TPA: thermonuclease family protein [Hyphomicrobium sp.]|nr:thermonuclease family protein [Hyphomicrobium sp.]
MQLLSRSAQRQLTKWGAALIVAILGALFGQGQFGGSGNRNAGGPTPPQVSGAARAIDGDSLFVGRDEVRMKGIDAPEGKQTCMRDGREWACGDAARDELRRLIGKDVVQCRVFERDKHGRLLAQCSAGGRDLNAGMVASGLAVAYGGYLREQGDAKAKRRGLWGSEFQQPRDWRHDRGIGR